MNEGISFDLKDRITCRASFKPLKTWLNWGIEDLMTSLGLTALSIISLYICHKRDSTLDLWGKAPF